MEELKQFVREVENLFDLPAFILFAIIEVESSWKIESIRHEPKYRWLWDCKHNKSYPLSRSEEDNPQPPKDFPGSKTHEAQMEYTYQRASWGLTQVMGGLARETGYAGALPALATKDGSKDAIIVAAKYLQRLYRRYKDIQPAISAYNAGNAKLIDGKYANQKYVDKVNVAWMKYKKAL